MTESKSDRVHALFEHARAVPASERPALVARLAAGDEELAAEVLSLLGYDDEAVREQHDFLGVDTEEIDASPAGLPTRIGRYEILDKIGEGGMGFVYEAVQDSPRRRVALKVLRHHIDDAQLRRRFEHEASVLGRLNHPGIAHIYEAGVFEHAGDAKPFFAMEIVEGLSLNEYATTQKIDRRARIELLIEIAKAVDYAHEQGVIHRDLKPSNILVDASGRAKILDFGIARTTDTGGERLTVERGAILGTLDYMSPEQVSGADVTKACDVFALGLIAFELLTGEPARDFRGDSFTTAAKEIGIREIPRLGRVDASLRGDLEVIVQNAVELEAQRRYQSAAALAEDLRRFLDDEPILARPPSAVYRIGKYARRNRAIVLGTGGIVVAALAVALAIHLVSGARDREREAERRSYPAKLQAIANAIQRGEDPTQLLEGLPERFQDSWEYRHLLRQDFGFWETRLSQLEPSQVCFSADGQEVITIDGGSTIGIWNRHGDRIRSIDAGTKLGPELEVHGMRLATASADGRVLVFDYESGELLQRGPPGISITALSFDPSGDRLAVARLDASLDRSGNGQRTTQICIGDLAQQQIIARPDDVIRSFAWASNGRYLLAGGWDIGTLVFEDRPWRQVPKVPQLKSHRSAFAGEAGIVAQGVSGAIRLMDISDPAARSWPLRKTLTEFPAAGLEWISVTPNAKRMITLAFDESRSGEGILWDLDTNRGTRIFEGIVVRGARSAISRDGNRAAIRTPGKLRVLEIGPAPRRVLTGHSSYVYYVDFSPDGRQLLSRGYDGEIRIWDATTLRSIRVFKQFPQPEGDGWHLVCSSCHLADGVLRVDDQRDRTRQEADVFCGTELTLTPIRGGEDAPTWQTCAYSPDARRIVTGLGEVLDADSFRVLRRLQGYSEPHKSAPAERSASASFSPDGRRVAVARHEVRIHDFASGEVLHTLEGNESQAFAVAWSPDGRRIATGGRDQKLRIYDAAGYDLLVTLDGHTSYIHDLAWSPDGSMLASASGDKTVRLWETKSNTRQAGARRLEKLRRELRPRVEALLARSNEAQEVARTLRENKGLADDERYASLLALRDLVDARWAQEYPKRVAAIAAAQGRGEPTMRALGSLPREAGQNWELRHLDAVAKPWLWKETLAPKTEWSQVRFAPDGKTVLTFQSPQAIGAWTPDGRHVRSFAAQMLLGHELAVCEGRLAAASLDGRVLLFDLHSGVKLKGGEPGMEITALAFDASGERLAVARSEGGHDGSGERSELGIISLSKGRVRESVVARHRGVLRDLHWSREGNEILASAAGVLRRWDTKSWREAPRIHGAMKHITFSRAGLVTTSDNDKLRVWKLPALASRARTGPIDVATHFGRDITCLVSSPDGERALTISSDDAGKWLEARLWDRGTRRATMLDDRRQRVDGRAAFSPDGQFLALRAQTLKLWDLERRATRALHGHDKSVASVDFSPDGRTLLSRSVDGRIRLWDARSLDAFADFRAEFGPANARVQIEHRFSKDGSELTLRAGARSAKLDVFADAKPRPVDDAPPAIPGRGQKRATSPDGNHVVSGFGQVYDARSGARLRALQDCSPAKDLAEVVAASFDARGRRVALARGEARIYDFASGALLHTLAGHEARVRAIAWSPDAARIATGDEAGTIRIFDGASYLQVFTLTGHTAAVNDLAWSPDGSQLASASDDKTVRVWDAERPATRHKQRLVQEKLREKLRPRVTALLPDSRDTRAAAAILRRATDLDADELHAALHVLRELAVGK